MISGSFSGKTQGLTAPLECTFSEKLTQFIELEQPLPLTSGIAALGAAHQKSGLQIKNGSQGTTWYFLEAGRSGVQYHMILI